MSFSSSPLVGIPTRSITLPGRREVVQGVFNAYIDSIQASGGVAVLLPPQAVETVHRLDALLLVGGEDLAAEDWWSCGAPLPPVDAARDKAEALLVDRARINGVPTLGLCRGAQLVNCVLGGTVGSLDPVAVGRHRGPNTSDSVTHHVHVAPNTRLASVMKQSGEFPVVSRHATKICDLGEGLLASAWASDRSIEAVESSDWPFLGVQWHAEWFTQDVNKDLSPFLWLIEEASRRN